MKVRLTEAQLAGLQTLYDARTAKSPSLARQGVPQRIRQQLFDLHLVNGAWIVNPAGEAALARPVLADPPPRKARRKPEPDHEGRYGVGADRTTRVRGVASGGLPSLGRRYS